MTLNDNGQQLLSVAKEVSEFADCLKGLALKRKKDDVQKRAIWEGHWHVNQNAHELTRTIRDMGILLHFFDGSKA